VTDLFPNHRERQFLQYLRGAGWVKLTALPDTPGVVRTLLSKGWIEQREDETGISYRMTEAGFEAKVTPIRR
jgi:hypothetical protein